MEYKDFDCGSYKVHLIKTDKFKTCHLEINFRSIAEKEKMPYYSMISDLLTDSCERFKEKKELMIYFEKLYKMMLYGTTNKTGKVLNTIFVSDFISPEYISDPNYFENALSLPFEMILHPNAINGEFAIKPFNIVKERLQREILSIEENSTKKVIHEALKCACEDTPTSYPILGTLSELESITPTLLYQEYEKMLKNSLCDIFIIGNVSEEDVLNIINKHFDLKTIKTHKLDLYVENKRTRKVKEEYLKGDFVQTSLSLIYNIDVLTDYEKNIVFHLYNYLLGSGGMTSKLYQNVREKNSLCYGISSMYLKYDSLLLIQVSLDDENREKALKLIKSCVKEMIEGKFSDEELLDAKKNLLYSLDMTLDNNIAILNNYVFHIFDNLPMLEERKKLIADVTKEDIIKLAKKINLNTIYYLKGVENAK